MQIYPKINNTDNAFSVRFQRLLFWGFFYTIIGGVLRKWVFYGGAMSNIILFGQLLLPLILGWQYSKTNDKTKNIYQAALVIYFLILCMMAANPLNHTIFHGILGIIIYFGFFYILLSCPKVMNKVNIDNLDSFLFIILVFETVLASIQYALPGDHILNRYTKESADMAAAIVGDAVRVTGSFSYLGGFGSLVSFYSFFVWSLVNRNKKPWMILISIFLTLYCGLMIGSRGSVIWAAIVIALGFYENSKTVVKKYIAQFAGIALVIGIVSIFFNPFKSVERAFDNWNDRTTQLAESGEQAGRINEMFFNIFQDYEYPVFGAGLGSTYQGANTILGISDALKRHGYLEGEKERIVFEGGYFLLFVRIVLFIVILSSLRIKRVSKLLLLFILYNSSLAFNTYGAFFIAMGLIWINNKQKIEKNSYDGI
jgi:hypothetical protein